MDRIDIKLLEQLEKNSRVSLKNLAKDLNIKTSTIYHRLHKLRESNILDRFTIAINPEQIGLTHHCLMGIRLKKMVIGKLDAMFLESFAKFLSDQYEEVLFSIVGDDELIWIICTFRNQEHIESFLKQMKENPYIESFTTVRFDKLIKGKKLFSFLSLFIEKSQGEFFDEEEEEKEKEDLQDEDIDEDDEDKDSSEVFF